MTTRDLSVSGQYQPHTDTRHRPGMSKSRKTHTDEFYTTSRSKWIELFKQIAPDRIGRHIYCVINSM